jgi:nucleoside-diphosphate-sugar epimerase
MVCKEYRIYIYESLNFILEILKRVVITGGNGFIGKHLLKKLASCKSISVVLISNTSITNANNLKDTKLKKDMPLTFYTADIMKI